MDEVKLALVREAAIAGGRDEAALAGDPIEMDVVTRLQAAEEKNGGHAARCTQR